DEKTRVFQATVQYLLAFIHERRSAPSCDLMSEVVGSRIRGEPIGEAEAVGMTTLLFFGGLGTVASMMGFIAHFLATPADERHQLAANPALIPQATEELIRRFGLSNTVRLVKQDREFHGAPLRKDDLIMVPISLSSMDERRWPDAMEVDFSRAV